MCISLPYFPNAWQNRINMHFQHQTVRCEIFFLDKMNRRQKSLKKGKAPIDILCHLFVAGNFHLPFYGFFFSFCFFCIPNKHKTRLSFSIHGCIHGCMRCLGYYTFYKTWLFLSTYLYFRVKSFLFSSMHITANSHFESIHLCIRIPFHSGYTF